MSVRWSMVLRSVELRRRVVLVVVLNLVRLVGLEVEVEGFVVDRWFIFGLCSR